MNRQQELTTEFLRTRHALFGFIFGFVRNTHDTEDIFQEVWIRFSQALAEGKDIQDQAKWCRGTARNLILHLWRDRRDDKVVVDEELLDLVEQAFTEQDSSQEYWRARQEAVSQCIGELPERSRELLRLKYQQGLSAEAVATSLRQSSAAVLMALSRVRRLLRECAETKLKVSSGTA
jgi:RNA polymerase sigma-70 factor (ECF subfamily)